MTSAKTTTMPMNSTNTTKADRPGGRPRRSSREATGPSIRPITIPMAIGARMYSPACSAKTKATTPTRISDLRAVRQQQFEIRLWRKPDDRRLLWRAVRHRIFRLDSTTETHFHAARFRLTEPRRVVGRLRSGQRKEFSHGHDRNENPAKTTGRRTPEDLAADIEQLKADIAKLTEQLQETGEHSYGAARRAAAEGVDQLKAQGEAAMEVCGRAPTISSGRSRDSVREKPLTALAIAAGVGFLFALMARR